MALTEAQKTQVRSYLGWSARFHQFDSRLEQAMNAVDGTASETLITDTLANGGILASLADIDTKLTAAHGRLKATKVGSIELNRSEVIQLRREGRRWVGRLASLLGVEVRNNAYGSAHGGFASFEYQGISGNYVGK